MNFDFQSLWRILMDSVSEGILITDIGFNVLEANRNLEIMLELGEWRGKSVSDILPRRALGAVEQVVHQIGEMGFCMLPRRINLISSKGVVLPLLVSGEIVINTNGNRIGYVFVFKDAIVQSEISSISWVNAVKSMKLSSISKGVYFPLHSLDRCLDELRQVNDSISVGQLIDEMQGAMRQLWESYDVLLKLPQLDEICNSLELKKINVAELVTGVFSVSGVRCELSQDREMFVISDEFKLQQLLAFCLDNLFLDVTKDIMEKECDFVLQCQDDFVTLNVSIWRDAFYERWKEFSDYLQPSDDFPYDWEGDYSLERILARWLLVTLGIRVSFWADPDKKITFRLSIPCEL